MTDMTPADRPIDESVDSRARNAGVAAMTLGDCDLARAAAAGDSEAFEMLFRRHGGRVARIGSRFFRSPAEVEEIIQETFLRAFLSLDRFRPERASFSTWLSRIAVNLCYDELRRRRRRRVVPLEEERLGSSDSRIAGDAFSVSSVTPENLLIQRDLAARLLDSLSPRDRVILVLFEVEGWTIAEIASALNWSKTRVKVRAFRARNTLRALLGRSQP